jgi:hypothetical protein
MAWGVTQLESMCLARVRPWVQVPAERQAWWPKPVLPTWEAEAEESLEPDHLSLTPDRTI